MTVTLQGEPYNGRLFQTRGAAARNALSPTPKTVSGLSKPERSPTVVVYLFHTIST